MKLFSFVLASCLVVTFGFQIYQLEEVNRLLNLPATAAGQVAEPSSDAVREPPFDVVATPEMDAVAIAMLESLPLNHTRSMENVGFLTVSRETGAVTASQPKEMKTRFHRNIARARFSVPRDGVVAIYHDHFRGTLPGPGTGDAGPVYKGWVSYIKDERGNIFKIEFSEQWKTPSNPRSGWRLTSLKGRSLPGQNMWYPGVTFTRYARGSSKTYVR
ncbi:hypothetical protein [Parendozoicomonas sp. Alg238-R29]|uniref:hypothetical protein n=1 Tax=Parendozoicomonas sp. Alg238-R29 TaxID=2993446 RepID=UPI00248F0DE1|nr:hypothetical protein [Parendozoicomonas sp. Alg238-R29]